VFAFVVFDVVYQY